MTISTNYGISYTQISQSNKAQQITQQVGEIKENNSLNIKNNNPDALEIYFGSDYILGNSELASKLKEHIDSLSSPEMAMLAHPWTTWIDANTDMNNLKQMQKDKMEEIFGSREKSINFFQSQIDTVTESETKYGGDPSHIIGLWSDVLKIFQQDGVNEQQNQYLALGQSQNNNG
ncbi:MAG: hypothetical protein PHF17_02745 [Arcobacteraceae bacterium]|nr:hypothetical protein [Arcobacteraceae bacterium]